MSIFFLINCYNLELCSFKNKTQYFFDVRAVCHRLSKTQAVNRKKQSLNFHGQSFEKIEYLGHKTRNNFRNILVFFLNSI